MPPSLPRVPVVGPLGTNSVVAVTGTNPSPLNEPVAAGRLMLPVIALVVRSADVASVPGPSGIEEWMALM